MPGLRVDRDRVGPRVRRGPSRELVGGFAARPPRVEHSSPTITVIAEFDEGPWWWSQIVDADPAELATGRRLRVAFEAAEGGETLPVFRLA